MGLLYPYLLPHSVMHRKRHSEMNYCRALPPVLHCRQYLTCSCTWSANIQHYLNFFFSNSRVMAFMHVVTQIKALFHCGTHPVWQGCYTLGTSHRQSACSLQARGPLGYHLRHNCTSPSLRREALLTETSALHF